MIVDRSNVRASALPGLLVIGTLSLVASPASAQQARLYQLGGGFLGGGKVEASVVRRENYFYESSGGISATGYRVRPEVMVNRAGSIATLALDAFLEHSRYDLPGTLDEYMDYGTNGSLSWRPLTKHGFELSAGYLRGHDQPGLLRTEEGPQLNARDIDEWESTRLGLSYRYGSPSSLASNELSVGARSREYVSNRADTQLLNYDGVQLGYQLSYAYSPKTSVLFTVGHSSTNYEIGTLANGNSRDGNELAVRTGLRWVATGKTSGQILIGARSYSVDGRARPAREGFSWRANFDWSPLDTTTLRLSTSQSTTETFRNDTLFIDDRGLDASWRQVWSERFNTTLKAGYVNSDFVGTDRTDETFNLSAGASYLLLRTVNLFGEYVSQQRQSTRAGRDYTAPEARVGLRWTP